MSDRTVHHSGSGQNRAVLLAILAAACYGISAPGSKLLMARLAPALVAALLYLGAGAGVGIMLLYKKISQSRLMEAPLSKDDLPSVLGMIALDIIAPILLLLGLNLTNPGTVSLLNNFEIVATSLIASLLFGEAIGRRMWLALIVITISCLVLSIEDFTSFSLSSGALLVLLAAICWGLENNLTRKLSQKDPLQTVLVKGFGSGFGALVVAWLIGISAVDWLYVFSSLLLGFFSYGLSISLYIKAQRDLGAARTSAFYAVAPFIGVALSLVFYGLPLTWTFIAGLMLMLAGAYIAASEYHNHEHLHEQVTHEHRHRHDDGHHLHTHENLEAGTEHSHPHAHERLIHSHQHTPDVHHRHSHGTNKG